MYFTLIASAKVGAIMPGQVTRACNKNYGTRNAAKAAAEALERLSSVDAVAVVEHFSFEDGERDTILAALRLLQMDYDRILNANPASQLGMIRAILEDHNSGLTPQEIDALCERINQ